jgi:transcriptional regulator GlxA family with amidase domain
LILANHKKFSLDWLANQACLSPRQFERKSNHYIGVSPKLFAKIARFNQSYNMRLKNPHEDWLSIAVGSGYHDYQHLVRDYKEFANASPNILFAEENKAPERILGLHK